MSESTSPAAATSRIPTTCRQNRSVADYDVPQRLVVSYVWQLPFGPGQPHFRTGMLSKVVGAWQVNGITSMQKGMPIVITGPNTANLPGLTSRATRLHSGALASGQTPRPLVRYHGLRLGAGLLARLRFADRARPARAGTGEFRFLAHAQPVDPGARERAIPSRSVQHL
jgi:hypothetical protein